MTAPAVIAVALRPKRSTIKGKATPKNAVKSVNGNNIGKYALSVITIINQKYHARLCSHA
jgi:hypothetical protein